MIRRLLIALFCVAVSTSCSRGIDKSKFEAVYRAGKAIEAALSVGVTYIKFGELVQAFAAEASIANDKTANAAERELVSLYAQALSACKDSLTIWKLKISGSGSLRITSAPELARIVDTYPIQGQGTGQNFSFDPDAALQVLWSNAGAKLAAANRIYNGEAVSELPAVSR